MASKNGSEWTWASLYGGERYHHHLAFGTRTLAADVCCETREDIYRRRLPPTVPYPLDINAFHLSWRPTEGLLTTDLLFFARR